MAVSVSVLVSTVMNDPAKAEHQGELARIEAQVQSDYTDVATLSPADYARMRAVSRPALLLDVREADEFAVSRIPGAVRVDPGIRTSKFLSEFASIASGREVVFYCSVGVRSSKLASRVQAGLKKSGARTVYNLQGGIFRWHNDNRTLEDAAGETDRVHPYSDYWGRLVSRQDLLAKSVRKM